MKKRVTTGFLSIVALLFVSGMLSLFELGHLSNDAESLMNESRSSMESAKEMLDALNDHSLAVSHIIMSGHNVRNDSLCRSSLQRIETVVAELAEHTKNNAAVDSLQFLVSDLNVATTDFLARDTKADAFAHLIVDDFVYSPDNDEGHITDTDIYWYDIRYDPLRTKISDQINDFMTLAFSGLTPQTEQLSLNAYRAVTPVLISLLVMIAIVLMLYYFILLYCVKPIIAINRSLTDWLKFRKSFTVKVECRDELHDLKENVETLTNLAEKNRL